MPDTSEWKRQSKKFEAQQFLNNLISMREGFMSLGCSGSGLEVSLARDDFRTVAVALQGELETHRLWDMSLDQAFYRGYFIFCGIKIKERRANESPWSDCSAGAADRAGMGG